MSICTNSLDKLGKAAFNNLTSDQKQNYLAASGIINVITQSPTSGQALTTIQTNFIHIGFEVLNGLLLQVSKQVTGKDSYTTSDAVEALFNHFIKTKGNLWGQIVHGAASLLAVLLGIDENPGILGAILEYIYKVAVKPKNTISIV